MKEKTTNKNTEKQSVDTESTLTKIIVAFIFVIAFFWGIVAYITRKHKKTKLYKIYGVTDKTFKKWIEYFCQDTITTETWKKKRLLSRNEFNAIQNSLGKPNPQQNYSKKELVKIFEFQNYEYLKWAIEDSDYHSDNSSFSLINIYNNLNKFPPKMKDELASFITKNKV